MAPRSPFPQISDYAFLSNCHTGALVAPDGSVEWLCVPSFDSPSVFGSLLDRGAGYFRISPDGMDVPSARRYIPGTNVLESTWRTPTGWVVVRDALTLGQTLGIDHTTEHTRPPSDLDAEHMLVRTVECVDGFSELELICEPAFDYGKQKATWTRTDDGHSATVTAAGVTLNVYTSMALGIEGETIRGRHYLDKGDQLHVALTWGEVEPPTDPDEANSRINTTIDYWRRWLARARLPDHPMREAIQRSALTIKGLTYQPTGATVAALTTSLPETPRGERNWDYRFAWMRDSTFTLQALHYLDLDREAEEFMQFMADLEPDQDGGLQIMYGIDGRRDLTEVTLDHLTGYEGARPVRIGNGAFQQRQHDVYGAVLDSLLLHTQRAQRLPSRLWPLVKAQAECATRVWDEPDQGIWEARGEPKHYVSSKLMCWVALDRAAKLAAIRGDESLVATWAETAETIKNDVLTKGVSDGGVLLQHYDTDALDASALLAGLFGFLPGADPRMRATVEAVEQHLTDGGYVLRYRPDVTDDGLHGDEGTFLICSFWLVSGLCVIGEYGRAMVQMQRLLRIASPLGLFAEEFDATTSRHLGNVPQAFSHLALIEAASRLILAERLAEYGL